MSAHEHEEHHLIPYGVYIKVWLALLVLTGITVWASTLEMYKWTVFTAMLIATVKVTLVVLYFMHIRFENKLFWTLIFAVLVTYAIFVGLTFADYFYR